MLVAGADAEQQLFERGDDQQREFALEFALADQRHRHRLRLGRQPAAAEAKDDREQGERRRKEVRDAVGQPERIDAVAAIEHHVRSEEHTSELQSLMRISYAVFCVKKKKKKKHRRQQRYYNTTH